MNDLDFGYDITIDWKENNHPSEKKLWKDKTSKFTRKEKDKISELLYTTGIPCVTKETIPHILERLNLLTSLDERYSDPSITETYLLQFLGANIGRYSSHLTTTQFVGWRVASIIKDNLTDLKDSTIKKFKTVGMQQTLLDYIPREDLPLYIDYPWCTKKIATAFKKRLSGR